jgi:chemotaxis protein CheD
MAGGGVQKVYLQPGDFAFAGPGTHMHTLLGSCISITLWHPRLRVGGMCHFTLPGRPSQNPATGDLDGRYADEALELFRRAARRHKTPMTAYQGKIFGGGNMIRERGQSVTDTVGARNAAAAMQLLMQEGVEILVAHVGEFGHRRIVFDVATGDVWVRHQPIQGKRHESLNGKV